ncbi:MAG TPA: site-2 protease family protein, partial [Actinomycetota bacterium]|nr:site-2 protease family protein [Actinomycetota bacterium]
MDLYSALGVALGFLFGIVGHEYVTARVATALGDRTPRMMGRLTLSPKAHVDPLGSLILPGVFVVAAMFSGLFPVMFGWGKRHSLSFVGLRNPKRDSILVALSGPATTLVLTIAFGAALQSPTLGSAATSILFSAMYVLLFLTVIELLPLPGRDGGRILQRFLSPSAAMKM